MQIVQAVKAAINNSLLCSYDIPGVSCGSLWKAFIFDPKLRAAHYINHYVSMTNWRNLEHETIEKFVRHLTADAMVDNSRVGPGL